MAKQSGRVVQVRREWRILYSTVLDGPETIACDGCGITLYGSGATIVIDCLDCYAENKGITKRQLRQSQRRCPEVAL